MKKRNDRVDLEFEKPQVKFIEQFRMRVNGGSNNNLNEYTINDKISKKQKQNNNDTNDPVIVETYNDDDDYDLENAQIVDKNDNEKINVNSFKPEYIGSKKQKNQSKEIKLIKSIVGKQEETIEKQKKEDQIKKEFSKTQVFQTQITKKSKLDDIVKKNNKPTILSFDQDDY